MLQSVLEGDEEANRIIIQDTVELSGRSLLKHCICSLVQRYTSVHVFLFDSHHKQWSHGLNKDITERLILHDCYSDGLGWSNSDSSTTDADSSGFLCSHSLQSKFLGKLGSVTRDRCAVVIDSLSLLLFHHLPSTVCRLLHEISNHCSTLLCLIHADLHSDHVISQLCHVMSTTIAIKPVKQETKHPRGTHSGMCSLQHKRRTGKILKKTELYTVENSFTKLTTVEHKIVILPEPVMHDPSPDPAANLTFDLRLSSKEKADRAQVVLPYTKAATVPQSEVGVVTSHRTGTGQIFYQPDEVDDFDESDPDDDLDF